MRVCSSYGDLHCRYRVSSTPRRSCFRSGMRDVRRQRRLYIYRLYAHRAERLSGAWQRVVLPCRDAAARSRRSAAVAATLFTAVQLRARQTTAASCPVLGGAFLKNSSGMPLFGLETLHREPQVFPYQADALRLVVIFQRLEMMMCSSRLGFVSKSKKDSKKIICTNVRERMFFIYPTSVLLPEDSAMIIWKLSLTVR